MILTDNDILGRIEAGEIGIEPFEKAHLGPVGYDLRLHRNFRVFRNDATTHIDVAEPFDVTELVQVKEKEGYFVIHPGQFVLSSTLEQVKLPNDLVGMLEGRSSLGRLGLIVHATASIINPGFSGHITFEMSNISNLPIKLYVGMRVAQIVFENTSGKVSRSYGAGDKYQDQEPPTASKIWKDFE